jgi:branched-chain amino acid transport system substrate-binding protein
MDMIRRTLLAATCGAALATPAMAQNTIKIAGLYELSGAGATSGTNFRDGAALAVKEINAAGGILGKKVELVAYDGKSDAATIANSATQLTDRKSVV